MKSTPKALLFDLDQTLFDRRTTFRRWLTQECQVLALNLEAQGRLISDLMNLDGNGYGDRSLFLNKCENIFRWKTTDDQTRRDYFKQGLVNCIQDDPQLHLLLADYGKQYPIGLCSNGKSPMQRAKIHKLGIADYCDPIIISGEVGVSKPDPAIFHLACDQWGLKPADVLMIGDHPRNDIIGAQAAGLKTCWIGDIADWDHPQSGPEHCIDDLLDLRKIVPL